MSDRPDEFVMRSLVIDKDHRLRKQFRDRAATVRCPRKRHLLAVAVQTRWGVWACAREPWVEHASDGGWQDPAWLADSPSWPQPAACTCGRHWTVDLVWLGSQPPGVVDARALPNAVD